MVLRHAAETGAEVSGLGLGDIAAIMGISRSTLIRRLGRRHLLDDALARLGSSPARPSVADRAVEAAARLYGGHGAGEVTLERIASVAGCTVQSIQMQLGGRDGLLTAVFDRYSPLGRVEAALADPPEGLQPTARLLYGHVLDALLGEPPVMAAMFAEIASHPNGTLAAHVKENYAPRFARLMTDWLAPYRKSGVLRPLPGETLLSLFAGPVLARSIAAVATAERLPPASRDHLAADLAEAFCQAVSA